jgi:O-antigen ligase
MEKGNIARDKDIVLKLFAFFFGIGGGLLSFIIYILSRIFLVRDWHFKFDISPVFLVLAFLISVLFSPFRDFALKNFFVLLFMYIAYLFLRREKISQELFSGIIDYLILGSVLLAFGGFVGYLYKGSYADTPFAGKNGLGTILATAIPLSQIELLQKKGLFYYLSFIFLVFGLVLSMSQGAFIGLSVAEGLILLFGDKKVKRSVLTLIIIVVIALGIFSIHSIITGNNFVSFLFSRLDMDSSSKVERIYIWQASWKIFLNHPISGVGIGTFPLVYPNYKFPQARESIVSFAHNLPLNLLVETGLLGFSAFFLFLFDIYRRGIILFKRIENKMIILALISSLTAYMVHQLFDGTIWSLHIGLGFWFMGALIFNLYEKT